MREFGLVGQGGPGAALRYSIIINHRVDYVKNN